MESIDSRGKRGHFKVVLSEKYTLIHSNSIPSVLLLLLWCADDTYWNHGGLPRTFQMTIAHGNSEALRRSNVGKNISPKVTHLKFISYMNASAWGKLLFLKRVYNRQWLSSHMYRVVEKRDLSRTLYPMEDLTHSGRTDSASIHSS